MSIYTPKELVFQMAEAATFKTGVLDNAAAMELSGGIWTFNPDRKLVRPDRYRGQKWADVFDLSNNAYGSLPTLEGESPVLKTEIADFLNLMIQNVTEVETTPFQKTFTYVSPGPDFSLNEGYFITFWAKSPVASTSEKIDSVIGEKLELSISPEANDGFLYLSFTGKGIGFSRTADPSGDLTKAVQSKFSFYDIGVCTLDGTPVILQELKLTLENEIVGVGSDGSGDFQNLVIAKPKVTAEIKGIWDAGMRDGLGKFDSGAETVLILSWGTTGTDGFLSFNLHGVVNDGNLAEDEVRGVNITIEGASDLANTEDMLTAEIADDVDRSW